MEFKNPAARLAIGVLALAIAFGLSGCSDHNSQILAPTVSAAQREGLRTNFVPHGEISQAMFDSVAPYIFRLAPEIPGHLDGFPTCTVSLIDDGGDPSGSYFVTADHCVDDITKGDMIHFLNPWDNSETGSRQIHIVRNPSLDLALLKWPNLQALNPDGTLYSAPEQFSGGIPLSRMPLRLGQEVVIAGYPGVANVPGIVGGKDRNLLANGFSDAILMTVLGYISDIPNPIDSGYITVTSTDFQPAAPGHSGSIMFVVEEGRLVAGGVMRGGWVTDDKGNTSIGVYTTKPIPDMINSMGSETPAP